MAGVLDGIRVVDLARVISGPFCTMLLADMGAEVIKVEGPDGESARNSAPRVPGGSAYWITHNRNKKSITLNLWTDKGKDILRELVKRSDIVVENFRPGVIAQIGFDYERLKVAKEDIILISVSGFGQTGPYAHRPAFDQIVQAMGGLTWLTGQPGTPPARAGVYVGDYLPGLYAAFGAVLALYHRDHTGRGQHVDVSMMDAVVSMVGIPIANYIMTGFAAERRGNRNMYSSIAPNNTYRLADGYVQFNANSPEHFRRFCQALNREDWLQDSRFQPLRGREEFGDELDAMVAVELAPRKVAEVVLLMERAGVPCGPVQSIPQIIVDPQVKARQMIVELEHPVMGKIPVPGVVVKMSGSPGAIRTAPPVLGANNEEVYGSILGYAAADIEAMKTEGII
jgi:crotonobetainyl-CoA:carnitine CoA-transferase CaiB-like acyl-CoA transferase